MKVKEYKEKYNLNSTTTGGNCKAFSSDLNTNQDTILVVGNEHEEPKDDSEEYTVAVFLNKEYGEPAYTFTTCNVDHLDELTQAIFTLWGN